MLLPRTVSHTEPVGAARLQRSRAHKAAGGRTSRATRAFAEKTALQSPPAANKQRANADYVYSNWLALPIQPGRVRRTLRRAAGPGVWLFEQSQGVLDVLVNTRMTVVQLRDGSLFVHAPIAPTPECLRLLRELGAPVRYVVLPTSAVEHKARTGTARPARARVTERRAVAARAGVPRPFCKVLP